MNSKVDPADELVSPKPAVSHWLVGGGEMGQLLRSMEWRKTPLGPMESWPPSLRTTVSLALSSNFPISIAWGPQHTQIYNDGYWPICAAKHPHSMGQDFTECWASAWPVIGAAFDGALKGEPQFLEDQRMYLDRLGYLEETFFTFSFSPIRDETGEVVGLFHPVTETTSKMLGQRRTRALRDVAARAGKAQDVEEALHLLAQTLAEYALDLPFVLLFLLDADGRQARLIAQTGLMPGGMASPGHVDLAANTASAWPIADVVQSTQARLVEDLTARFGVLRCGPYEESLKQALVLPISTPGSGRPAGVLVAGVSSRLPLNEAYRAFFDLLAAGTATVVANARAYEEERRHAEALAEIDRAKTAFFSNVSHEFRTPLTLMLGPMEDELAETENPLPAKRRERLATAHRNSLRLLKMVNTLLDFSRIEAGRAQAVYEATDLSVLTAELASVFRSAAEGAGLTLQVDCPPLPEPIHVDREMWEKVVFNLLSNAFKHTFKGGIVVRLAWCIDHAEMTVADTGIGIPEHELPRLFERFHRVKGAKSRSHEGTGIGLALASELVQLHGGTISVRSRENEGTTFTVTLKSGRDHLPADRIGGARDAASTAIRGAAYVEEALHWLPNTPPLTAAVPPLATGTSCATENGTTFSAERARIVWADDNADLRAYVCGLLSPWYDVEAVPDGAAALQAARNRPPDLVLSDVMMPVLDGFALLRQLRADSKTRTVPVILLSARAGEEAVLEGLDRGADDYLAKPFTAQELLARVRTHLTMARSRNELNAELARTNEELEAFSHSVAHDLRAPLRSIDGFSSVLLSEHGAALDADARHCLERVLRATQGMSQMIDDLLMLSRVGRTVLRRSQVGLSALAQEILETLRLQEPDRSVRIELVPGLTTQGDPGLLRIALDNLLGNAWKYTGRRPDAQIEFGATMEEDGLVYFVRDNGAGFDMKYAGKLFNAFQRLHTLDEFPGTGIGLATVERIVRKHGGRIWADAVVGKGATFYFTLS